MASWSLKTRRRCRGVWSGELTAERFAVDVARDGKSGWELAQTYQYDLVILDLMLPQLSGGERSAQTSTCTFPSTSSSAHRT